MTTGIVAFNYASWVARYPELGACVAPGLAQEYFNEAQLYCNNTPGSPVRDASPGGRRDTFLKMLTAHIAALNACIGGNPAPPLVGRINSASEGSVSVQAENNYPPGSVQWFQQTKYGAAYWQASAQYRTMAYVVSPARVVDPYAPFFQGNIRR